MKLSLSWLARHINVHVCAKDLAQRLIDLGLEVEDIHDKAALYVPFTVAEVQETRPHPQADKLRLCTVRTADGTVREVVCGAPNVHAPMHAIFAPEGSVIPATGVILKPAVIRGVESRGMLVSFAEMALEGDSEGIIEIEQGVPLGTPLLAALGMSDAPVLDISLTPNRGDATCVRGIARDLAAAGMGLLQTLSDESPLHPTLPDAQLWHVCVEDFDLCPLFLVREIAGLTNNSSPKWLCDLLQAADQKTISGLVDITNFFAIDRGRPLHVYDADKIQGTTLTIRPAKTGEEMEALDGYTYIMTGGEPLICDAAGPVAIGGIIGGARTACSAATRRVLLESALFDPLAIACTGRTLGIESASRYRFERGVDRTGTAPGLEAATRMIIDLCGGQVGPISIAGAPPSILTPVRFDPAATNALLGLTIDAGRQADILRALGFVVEGGKATPPPWRYDIHCSADLADEIARIVGLDAIKSQDLPFMPAIKPIPTPNDLARRTLVRRGFEECVTPSFMDEELAVYFGPITPAMRLENPIARDLNLLRPSALPHLIAAAVASARRGHPDVALAEMGPFFTGGAPGEQQNVAALVRAGATLPRHWSGPVHMADAFDAKADVLRVLETLGVRSTSLQVVKESLPDAYHPGRSGIVRQGALILAHFGEIHPFLAARMGVRGALVMAEIFIDVVPVPKKKRGMRPCLDLPDLQPVVRDFAFIVDATIEACALVRAVAQADPTLITNVDVFDVYEGLEGGTKKSIAIGVTIQPNGKTALTEDQISILSDKICAGAVKATKAVLRSL